MVYGIQAALPGARGASHRRTASCAKTRGVAASPCPQHTRNSTCIYSVYIYIYIYIYNVLLHVYNNNYHDYLHK